MFKSLYRHIFNRSILSKFLIKGLITLGLAFLVFQTMAGLWAKYTHMQVDVQGARLDRLRPYFEEFLEHQENPGWWDKNKIQGYIIYYKQVNAYKPTAEAYGMLGFFEHLLGKREAALVSYQKAVRLNPHFFWFHYNLGILYLESGLYQEANASFKNALSLAPQETIDFMFSSKIYHQIIASADLISADTWLANRLDAGYQESIKGLFMSEYALKTTSLPYQEEFHLQML
jgi:tetratricopeptide (TPR) repeat protein